jgi:hypothetical protein
MTLPVVLSCYVKDRNNAECSTFLARIPFDSPEQSSAVFGCGRYYIESLKQMKTQPYVFYGSTLTAAGAS